MTFPAHKPYISDVVVIKSHFSMHPLIRRSNPMYPRFLKTSLIEVSGVTVVVIFLTFNIKYRQDFLMFHESFL